jgi:uncharacterized membrane protein
MESAKRTITKAILWNLMGLLSMAGVGYAATGSLALGGGLAIANTLVGFICYVIYERVWSGIHWGRHV